MCSRMDVTRIVIQGRRCADDERRNEYLVYSIESRAKTTMGLTKIALFGAGRNAKITSDKNQEMSNLLAWNVL
jgi:hypothetical protein